MPRKTLKASRKMRRKTLRRVPRKTKKGGADTQALIPPDSAFKNAAPVPAISVDQKIA